MPNTERRMPRRYYNGPALKRTLQAFEERFQLASADFYDAYLEPEDSSVLREVPLFERHVWADLYRESRRVDGSDFAERAQRELELA